MIYYLPGDEKQPYMIEARRGPEHISKAILDVHGSYKRKNVTLDDLKRQVRERRLHARVRM